ncbi:extracellular solute-binding protein [Lacisediminihabitans profunda]|uniref:extracellular solute-binding protein n=1 Tax=Lacisediminihabitans profunda TaxID=2594790 RepID=UPI00165098C5|nr:extracellular solute-binding protein [Lacisediminihabitans profunda]
MSRSRIALAGVSITAAALLLAGCSAGGGTASPSASSSGSAEDTAPVSLTFVGYGGVGQDAMIKYYQQPYMAQHPNVTFVNTSPPDVAQVQAQVQAGSIQQDIVATSPAAAQQGCGTIFEPLDLSSVDQKNLVPQTVGKCYIGNFINASPFAYRTDAFPDPSKAPKTLADFFNTKKFPGKRGMLTNLQNGILEYPLLADGVKPDKLYPLDIDRSLKKLDSIRNDTIFAPNVGVLQQDVASGQVDMFMLADSRDVPLLDSGTKITIVWDKTVASINAFAVPKGDPKAKAAEAFLASAVANPAAVTGISETLGVAPVNLATKPVLSANAKKLQVYNKTVNPGTTVLQDVAWYTKNFTLATQKLNAWLAG